ncbi:MBOAT family O-acyltransferase [Spartinivicinus ruber]|uniref:MBOAT family O-acyltransferase n=1 Tax=Spartinivicinus ruber TaxID=2683272 RepID=UPI0013D59189|nr:MBOAT family protein [Spartinivicinus ruber]
MNFQSFHFFIFFIIVLIIVRGFLWGKNNLKKAFLLIASYYFYMCWDWRFASLILTITLINYVIGPRIFQARTSGEKKGWLALSLISNLGILAYFKYANFFIESMQELLSIVGASGELRLLDIILPIGISFYTFQSISYTLDIYRGNIKPVQSCIDFALFVAFFPQLVAGPIVRANHFLPQLEKSSEEEPNSFESGISLIIRGFIKKIAFADILALHIVDPVFAKPSEFSPLFLLIAIYAYSFQVYMDFSAYTDIARGIARTLGYELPINFNRPYKAVSISEFWQRWHISMSSFFRDYLFFSLGGSKQGNVYFNLLITFVAIGIWHGAGWNFVLYGLCHGAMVCIERWRRLRRERLGLTLSYSGWRLVLQVFLIFNIISLTRILFRGGTVEDAINYAKAMLDFNNTNLPLSFIGMICLLAVTILHFTPSKWTFDWKVIYCRLPVYVQAISIACVAYGLLALSSGAAPFIYFQF